MDSGLGASSPLVAFAAVIVATGVASALGHVRDRHRSAAVLKMTAATGYLGLALVSGALDTGYGRVILLALALCWLGDLLLIRPGSGPTFLAGLGSFLLGHVAYAAAFVIAGVSVPWVAAGALPAAVVGLVVLRWLWLHQLAAPMRGHVVAYVVAITVMVALSWGVVGLGAVWMVPAGAMAFMASDVFVARERFVRSSSVNTTVGLPLYFLGQVLLALTV
jgi:uncharacterized membrane protein YhhN